MDRSKSLWWPYLSKDSRDFTCLSLSCIRATPVPAARKENIDYNAVKPHLGRCATLSKWVFAQGSVELYSINRWFTPPSVRWSAQISETQSAKISGSFLISHWKSQTERPSCLTSWCFGVTIVPADTKARDRRHRHPVLFAVKGFMSVTFAC